MPSRFIFRSQLNGLVQALVSSGIDTEAVQLNQDLSGAGLKIELPIKVTHKSSEFYFRVSFGENKSRVKRFFSVLYYPGNLEPLPFGRICDTWDCVSKQFGSWLKTVQRELSQPDPWYLLNQGTILKDEIPTTGHALERFSDPEILAIKEHLNVIREFLISEANPNAEQRRLMDERLHYLEESAKRQAKQDWAHTAVGVMFTIAIGLAMAPEQANRLLQLTASFIKTIFVPLLK